MNDTTKPFWQSRTLWFNLISVTLIFVETQLQVLKALVPPAAYPWLVLVLPLGNAWLRAVTDIALTTTKEAPKP